MNYQFFHFVGPLFSSDSKWSHRQKYNLSADVRILFSTRESQSHGSAAPLNTVLRTTMLSLRNIRFSGTCQIETPQLINTKFRAMKFCVRYPMCHKWLKSVGLGRLHRWVKYILKNFSQ
jgi:hypothetical protein